MAKLKNIMMTAAIFYVLVILIVNFWGGFRTSYDLGDEGNLQNDMTIFEQLQTLNLIEGINKLQTGILKLTSVNSAQFDILGGLATSSIGVLQTIGGIITFIPQVFGIVTGFYPTLIPEIIPTLLGFVVIIAMAVLLISAKLGFDLR